MTSYLGTKSVIFFILSLLYFNEEGELLALALIFISLLVRSWMVPILLVTPIIGGGVDTESILTFEYVYVSGIVLGTIPLLIAKPVFTKTGIYVLCGMLVIIFGGLSSGTRTGIFIEADAFTFLSRFIYFLLVSYQLGQLSKKEWLLVISNMWVLLPFAITLVCFKTINDDVRIGFYNNYLNYGNTTHGYFSTYLSFLWILFLALFVFLRRRLLASIIVASVGLLTAYTVFMSASRNGLISFVFLTVVVLYIGTRNKIVALGTIAVIVVLGVSAFYTISDNPLQRRLERVDNWSSHRLDLYEGAFDAFQSNIIFGLGNSSSEVRKEILLRTGLDNVSHNTLLEYTLRYGIFGLVYILIPIIIILSRVFSIFNSIPLRTNRWSLPLLFGAVSIMLSSQAVSWVWSTNSIIPFIVYFSCYGKLHERKDS